MKGARIASTVSLVLFDLGSVVCVTEGRDIARIEISRKRAPRGRSRRRARSVFALISDAHARCRL